MQKVLYFVKGLPTDEDKQKAASAGALLRDALAWHEGDFIEQCDAVMGRLEDVPLPYRNLLVQQERPKAENGKKRSGKKELSDEEKNEIEATEQEMAAQQADTAK